MKVGYARVSREEQHLELQLDALKAAVLFVEIRFRIQTITFRSTSLFKVQNGHALTHIFSLHHRPQFPNDHSSSVHPILQGGEVISDTNEKISALGLVWCKKAQLGHTPAADRV